MDHFEKRFKPSTGAATWIPPPSANAAANLPVYQPPAPVARVSSTGSPSHVTSRPSASVSPVSTGSKPGLRLTVKAPPSKLRQATSSSAGAIPPNPYANASNGAAKTGAEVNGRPARSTRNTRKFTEVDSDEEDEDAEAEDEEMEGGEADVDRELLANDDDDDDEDEDEEEEDEDAEGEEDESMMDVHPPPPIIKQLPPKGKAGKPNVTVSAPPLKGALKSVEAKEMEDASNSDEELSELDSQDEDETGMGPDEDVDADGDSLTPDSVSASRSATPDLSKLSKRQAGIGHLMSLSNEATKKKHLTVEEHAMRRQEMARRRKKLSERKREDEKNETIKKLLEKPAPKRRTRAEILADELAEARGGTPGTTGADGEAGEAPEPGFTRYVQNARGARLGVPVEWMEAPVGEMFARGSGGGGRMVEEVA